MVQLLADYLKDSENVIIEIEDPDHATDAASKDIQTRRMNFYFKNGIALLNGFCQAIFKKSQKNRGFYTSVQKIYKILKSGPRGHLI